MEWYTPPSNIDQLIKIVAVHDAGIPERSFMMKLKRALSQKVCTDWRDCFWTQALYSNLVQGAVNTYNTWVSINDPRLGYSISDWNAGRAYQSTRQTALLNMYADTSAILSQLATNLPTQDNTNMLNQINLKKNNLPLYVQGKGENGGAVALKVPKKTFWKRDNGPRVTYSWGGRRKGNMMNYYKYPMVVVGYEWTKNANFDNACQEYIDANYEMLKKINSLAFNNCDNENTLLDYWGLQSCGINDALSKFQRNIQSIKNQSNYVMSKLNNTAGFPQYTQAKSVDDLINNYYNWSPLNERLIGSTNYASLTKAQILLKISTMETHVKTLYGNCVLPTSRIALNTNDVPYCVTGDYVNAAQTCGTAISMSNGIGGGYGLEKLSDLWTDVSNSIPGNLKAESTLILNTCTNSCNKWVDMFNQWEEAEQKALSEPCISERPIESNNDPVLIKKANDWSIAASNHIKQLMIRLKNIQKYTQNYPNILQLKKDDVTLAPYSLPVTAVVKKDYNNSKNGESPMQSLVMIVPNGKPGQQGSKGISGLTGKQGSVGDDGPIGPMGNRNVPEFKPLNN